MTLLLYKKIGFIIKNKHLVGHPSTIGTYIQWGEN
jgi:hypothetical protein